MYLNAKLFDDVVASKWHEIGAYREVRPDRSSLLRNRPDLDDASQLPPIQK